MIEACGFYHFSLQIHETRKEGVHYTQWTMYEPIETSKMAKNGYVNRLHFLQKTLIILPGEMTWSKIDQCLISSESTSNKTNSFEHWKKFGLQTMWRKRD